MGSGLIRRCRADEDRQEEGVFSASFFSEASGAGAVVGCGAGVIASSVLFIRGGTRPANFSETSGLASLPAFGFSPALSFRGE